MKKKSKFWTFILSVIPGLSHLYLGCPRRAVVFFGVFLGLFFGALLISGLSYISGSFILPLAFFGYCLIWFIALAEALKLAEKGIPLDERGEPLNPEGEEDRDLFFINDHKLIALAFSAIPGGGHMFLGLLKSGAQLMAAFFLILLLSSWLDIGALDFILPVIWFYSVFDIYHLLDDEKEIPLEASSVFDWFSSHPRWIGWGLIILGFLVLGQRILNPLLEIYLTSVMYRYIETVFVALLLIGGGIKLLSGTKLPAEIQPEELKLEEEQS